MLRVPQFDQARIEGTLYRYGDKITITIKNQPPIKVTITGLEKNLLRYRAYRKKLHMSVRYNQLDSIEMGWA